MPDDVLELGAIAALFRVTEKTIRLWIDAGMPVVHRGRPGRQRDTTKISLRAAVEWYFRANHERLQLDRERAGLARQQAAAVRMQCDERESQLVHADRMAEDFAEATDCVVGLLSSIPSGAAPILATLSDPCAVQAHLERVLHAALTDVAAYPTWPAARRREMERRARRVLRHDQPRGAAAAPVDHPSPTS